MQKTVLGSVLGLALILITFSIVSADTIILKSGEKINAEILEKMPDHIVTYFL